MPIFLVDREFSGLEYKLHLIFGNRDLAFFVSEGASPDDLVSRLSSSKEVGTWSGPQRIKLYIIANVASVSDLERHCASVSLIVQKLDSDDRTKSRVEVVLCFCLRTTHAVEGDLEKQIRQYGPRFPPAFVIPGSYRDTGGLEIPLTKPEIESHFINLIILGEYDNAFLLSPGRKGLSWMTLAKGHMFLSAWHADRFYCQMINAVQESLFFGEDKPIVLDKKKLLESIENEIPDLPVAAFIHENAIRPKITEFLKKSFAEDYSEMLCTRLKDRFAVYFEEGPSERAKHETTEYLKRSLGKERNLRSFKDRLPAFIDQLQNAVKDALPMDQLFAGAEEEVRTTHLMPLNKKISELRTKILKRWLTGAGVILVVMAIGILGLKTNILSLLSAAQLSLAILIAASVLALVSRHQIVSLNRSQGVLRGILDKYGSQRKESIRAASLTHMLGFIDKFVNYLKVVSYVLDEESKSTEGSLPTRYLEMADGRVLPGYLDGLQAKLKEALLERVFRLWYEEPVSFRTYYADLKKNFKDMIASDLERESIETLSRHFNDYKIINTVLTSLPVSSVPLRGPERVDHRASQSVLGVSRDIILATDRLIGEFEYRQLERRNTIILAHFLLIKQAD